MAQGQFWQKLYTSRESNQNKWFVLSSTDSTNKDQIKSLITHQQLVCFVLWWSRSDGFNMFFNMLLMHIHGKSCGNVMCQVMWHVHCCFAEPSMHWTRWNPNPWRRLLDMGTVGFHPGISWNFNVWYGYGPKMSKAHDHPWSIFNIGNSILFPYVVLHRWYPKLSQMG